jgi:hypothetical protein
MVPYRLRVSVPCLVPIALVLFGCGGGSSSSSVSGGSNPVPSITIISPSVVTAGSAAFTLSVFGADFVPSSAVEWNGSALPTNYKNSTLLTASVTAADIQSVGTASVSVSNPLPGGGISGALKLQMNLSSTTGVVAVNLLANDLVWDPVRQQFYLSLPSADGSTGNAVQVMHMDGSLGANVFAGSEPHLLSMSAKGQNLYVSLDGSSSVLQMALPNLTVSNAIALGSDPLWGPYFAMDVEASPVADGTVAVVRGEVNLDPMEEGGVVIYDNGVARPDALCGFAQDGCNSDAGLLDSIQWNSDGTEMYAANYEDTGFNFYTVPVTSSGFGTATSYPGDFDTFYGSIHYDATTQLVYDDDGTIVDPSNGTVVGAFTASGIMVPDGKLGLAYFIGQYQSQTGSSSYTIASFDIQRFTRISEFSVTGLTGFPTHLIRWGSNGLALTTETADGSAGTTYLISNSFVTQTSPDMVHAETVRRTWKFPLSYQHRMRQIDVR